MSAVLLSLLTFICVRYSIVVWYCEFIVELNNWCMLPLTI
uniref:Uncharacterized protein n=1 Tax=Arundo donax TaxID=35708 RepID=A0A0A9AGS6_ARUDO